MEEIDLYDRDKNGCCEQCSVRADLPDGNDTECGNHQCACHTDRDYRPSIDPAKLLPYECRFEEDDPNTVKLPSSYKGSMEKNFLDVIKRSGKY